MSGRYGNTRIRQYKYGDSGAGGFGKYYYIKNIYYAFFSGFTLIIKPNIQISGLCLTIYIMII